MGRPCVLRRRRYEKSPGRAAWRALAVPHARRFGNRHPVPGSEPLRGHVGSQRVRFLPPVGAGASIPHTLRHLRARASHPCPFSAPARLCRRVLFTDEIVLYYNRPQSRKKRVYFSHHGGSSERLRPPDLESARVNRRAFYNGHTEQNTMEVKLF